VLTTWVNESADWGDELRNAWRELEASSVTATPFQSHSWVSAWWETVGRRRRPRIVVVREGRDWVGLLPLYRAGVSGRILRVMGSGSSDYLQPLARAGYEAAVANALTTELLSAADTDLLDVQQLRDDQPLAKGLEAQEQQACWALDLPGSWDAYLGSLSKSLRYEARRSSRSGRTTLQTLSGQSGFTILVDLHRRRWRSRGLPGVFYSRRICDFHRRFLARAEGKAAIRVLERDGEPIGAIYLLQHGRSTYFYQAGMDPSAKRWSPGTTLIAESVRRAIDEGHERFDFLRGDEPYKLRWKPRRLRTLRVLHPIGDGFGRVVQGWHALGYTTERLMRSGWARLGWGS